MLLYIIYGGKKKKKIKLYNNACVEIGVNLEFKLNILPYI